MKPVCYLDLDGVLVDFVAGAFAVHGRSVPPDQVSWGFPCQIGFSGVDDPAFWSPMGHDFWAGLGWTPEGRTLLSHLERIFGKDRVVILTSPCATPGSVEGKVAWIRNNMPEYSRQFFVGPPKHLVAGPGKILIDDYEGNIDKFSLHGGRTVLVPRPWNRKADRTIDGRFDVDDVLDDLSGVLNDMLDKVS